MSEAQLYRHYDAAGVLLYVGVSLNVVIRLTQHRIASKWYDEIRRIDVEPFPDKLSALKAEAIAIRNEKPRHNISGRRSSKLLPKDKIRRLSRNSGIELEEEEPFSFAGESRGEIIKRIISFKPAYTVKEAAELLRVSEQKLKKEITAGRIGSITVGDDPDEVDKLVRGGGPRPVILITGWQIIDFLEDRQVQNVGR